MAVLWRRAGRVGVGEPYQVNYNAPHDGRRGVQLGQICQHGSGVRDIHVNVVAVSSAV